MEQRRTVRRVHVHPGKIKVQQNRKQLEPASQLAADILRAAHSLLGVPFLHQGRKPDVGLDCAGLVVASIRAAGLRVDDEAGYARTPFKLLIVKALKRQPCLVRIPVAMAGPGDVLLLRFEGEPQHLAIRSPRGMIHAYERIGKVCEHRLSASWASKIDQAYRAKPEG